MFVYKKKHRSQSEVLPASRENISLSEAEYSNSIQSYPLRNTQSEREVMIAKLSRENRSVTEGLMHIKMLNEDSYARHREKYHIKEKFIERRNEILIHIAAIEIAMLRAKQSREQFKNTIIKVNRTTSTIKRITATTSISLATTATGIAGGAGGAFLGTLVAPGPGTVFGSLIGAYMASKSTSTMLEYVIEKSGLVTSVNIKTSKLFKIFTDAENSIETFSGYTKRKFLDMDPRKKSGKLKITKEFSKLCFGKLPTVGPIAKNIPEAVELGHEVRRAHEGLDQDKFNKLIKGTELLIVSLKDSLMNISLRNQIENAGNDLLLEDSLSIHKIPKLDFDIRLSKLERKTNEVIKELEANLIFYKKNYNV